MKDMCNPKIDEIISEAERQFSAVYIFLENDGHPNMLDKIPI